MLKLTTPIKNPKNANFLRAALLFISITGAFFSILQIPPLQPPGILPPLESFRVLLNHLFTISEANQAYLYERFAVSVPPESYAAYAATALGILILLTGGYIIVMEKLQSKTMGGALLLLLTGVQIYFGVFAAPVWNIMLYAALAWFFLCRANRAVFAGGVVAVAVVAALFYPGASPWLSQTSEAIRDRFGNIQTRPAATNTLEGEVLQNPPPAQPMDMRPGAAGYGNDPGDQAYGIDRDQRFSGSQIGAAIGQRIWLLWLIGAAFVMGYAMWFLLRVVKAYRRLAVFNSPDCRAAIDSMFRHLARWLAAFGAAPQGGGVACYADYAPGLAGVLPGRHSQEYLQMVELWQKCVYSSHPMTEDDRRRMRGFLDDVRRALSKTVNPVVRLQVKLRLLLQAEA